MPPIPLPHALSVGIDVVYLPRIEKIVTSFRGQKFLQKMLHQEELDELTIRVPQWESKYLSNKGSFREPPEKYKDPVGHQRFMQFIAGRWAAKEATKKAVGAMFLRMKDVRVGSLKPRDGGAIHVIYPRRDRRERLVEQMGSCSISHDGDYVVASVLAVPLKGPVFRRDEESLKLFKRVKLDRTEDWEEEDQAEEVQAEEDLAGEEDLVEEEDLAGGERNNKVGEAEIHESMEEGDQLGPVGEREDGGRGT